MNLEDEVLCGYPVTSHRKHMNAIYLEMMREFDRLCKKHGFTWWMIAGGLLGAVRHKGFIPWDDDIDVALPRKDFDRLMLLTNEQFGAEEPYFLQNPVNDPLAVDSLLRFRRSDTTCIRPVDYGELLRMTEGAPYNMGLGIAIFPIDNYPRSAIAQKWMVLTSNIFSSMMFRAFEPPEEKPVKYFICHSILKLIGPVKLMYARHWPYRCFRKNRSGMVHYFAHNYKATTVFPAEDFAGTVMLPFEDMEIPAPVNYDRVLRNCYGDYMTFPPVQDRGDGCHHAYESYDTPYIVSVEKLRSGEVSFPNG